MRIVVVALALSAAAMPAVAGTVITSDTSTPKFANGKSVVYLEADRVRVESSADVMIFRGDQNTAYVLQPAEKKFLRMTPEAMKKLAAEMEAARARMAEQMKSMSPEQRAQVEKMMPGGVSAKPPQVEFRKAGGTATFGKWKCDRVEQLMNGRPQAQLCVAKLTDLGLSEQDLAPLRRFDAFMQQAAPQAAGASAAIDPQALAKVVGYEGFPVHSEIPAAKVQTTTKSIEKKELAADLFEVPAGYHEETMPEPPH